MVNQQQQARCYRIDLHRADGRLYSKTHASNWDECLALVRALAKAEPTMTVHVVRIEELDGAARGTVEQAVREARGG